MPIDAGVGGPDADDDGDDDDDEEEVMSCSSCAAVTPVMETASDVRRYARNVRSSAGPPSVSRVPRPQDEQKDESERELTEVVAHRGPRHLDADVPQPRARDRPPRAVRRRHGAQRRLQLRQGLRPLLLLLLPLVGGGGLVPRRVRGRAPRDRTTGLLPPLLLAAAPRRELERLLPRRGGRGCVAAAAVAALEVRAVCARVRGRGAREGHAC
jgi:hypothetical protein